MDEIVKMFASQGQIFWAVLYGGLLSAIATFILKGNSNQKKFNETTSIRLDNQESMDAALALGQLNSHNERCKIKGHVSLNDRSIFLHIYDNYEKAGGNGVAKSIYKEFMALFERTSGLTYPELEEIENRSKNEMISEFNKILDEKFKNMSINMEKCIQQQSENVDDNCE